MSFTRKWQLLPEVGIDDPVPMSLDHLNPKLIDFDIVSRTTAVPNLMSFRSGVFVLSC